MSRSAVTGTVAPQNTKKNTPWTADLVAKMRRLWRAGYSFAEIRSALGLQTRQQVAGKIFRLGLQRYNGMEDAW